MIASMTYKISEQRVDNLICAAQCTKFVNKKILPVIRTSLYHYVIEGTKTW